MPQLKRIKRKSEQLLNKLKMTAILTGICEFDREKILHLDVLQQIES